MVKNLEGWKTIIFNSVAVVAPVLQQTSAVDIGLEGDAAAWYALFVALVNIVLRSKTKTPVFQKSPR